MKTLLYSQLTSLHSGKAQITDVDVIVDEGVLLVGIEMLL